jgi:hypothetical protein
MSLNSTPLKNEEQQELNEILFDITSSIKKNQNQENIREQCSKMSQLIKSKINNNQAINFIIKNISSFITLESINGNHKGFNLLDSVIKTLNPDEMIIFLSEILTALQENIADENIQDIENSYLNILKGCHEIKENSEIFKLLNGFCVYNMKQNNLCSQEIGVKTFLALINFLSLNGAGDNHDFDVQKIIWENIYDLLEDSNFVKKYELLNCLNELILISENNFEQFAAIALYKILDYLNDENDNNKIITLDIIKNLLIYCENSITPLKEQIKNFLKVIENSQNEKIEEEYQNILKLLGINIEKKKITQSLLSNDSIIRDEKKYNTNLNYNKENENEIDLNKNKNDKMIMTNIKKNQNPLKIADLNNKVKKKIPTTHKRKRKVNKHITKSNSQIDEFSNKNNYNTEIIESEISNNDNLYNRNIIPEYENKISILLSQMKTMSDKQLYLLDVISNIQNYSTEQINLLNQKIENLENNILNKNNDKNNDNLSQNENIINKQLKKCISSGDESSIINCISNINLKDIKELEIDTIENTLLAICPILSKGNNIHECITFIKAILMSYNNQFKLRDVTLKNINDILLYIKDNINDIKDEDSIDISLLVSYLNKR